MSMSAKRRISKIEINRAIFKEHKKRWLRRTALCAVVGVMILLALRFFTPMQVHGSSMHPTLLDEQWVLINRLNRSPDYGDIVVAVIENEWIVKRVMGLPGDTVDIQQDGTVVRNGEPIVDDPATLSHAPCDMIDPAVVPEDTLFLMGDNRAHSVDSRSARVGMVPFSKLIGILDYIN